MIKGLKCSVEQLLENQMQNGTSYFTFIPVKATLLAYDMGTIASDESGQLYLVKKADWFRYAPHKQLPQVDEFNELQDKNLTIIKDKIVRSEKE